MSRAPTPTARRRIRWLIATGLCLVAALTLTAPPRSLAAAPAPVAPPPGTSASQAPEAPPGAAPAPSSPLSTSAPAQPPPTPVAPAPPAAPAPAPEPADGARFADAIEDALGAWTSWPILALLVRFLLLSALAWLIDRLVAAALRGLWALGFDRARRLAYAVPALRLLLLLAIVFVGLGPLHASQPASAIALGTLIALAASVWGLAHARDVVAGFVLALQRPFHLGDTLSVAMSGQDDTPEDGSHADTFSAPGLVGRVVGIGLTRVRLQTPNGAVVDVPTAQATQSAIRLGQDGRALPVHVRVRLSRALSQADGVEVRRALRDHAFLSAYADRSAPVRVTLRADGDAEIVATPIHPDVGDELVSDLVGRAARAAPRSRRPSNALEARQRGGTPSTK